MDTVPSSFPSVEAAEDWFRDKGVVITSSWRDRSGKLKFDACRVYADGRCEYWLTDIGRTLEAREDVWEAEQPVTLEEKLSELDPERVERIQERTEELISETKEEIEAANDMEVVEPTEEGVNNQ
jgi:hypothetical protein